MYFAQYDIKINYETRKKVGFCHQVKEDLSQQSDEIHFQGLGRPR